MDPRFENSREISPNDELFSGEAIIFKIGGRYLMVEIHERDGVPKRGAIDPERCWFGNSPEELFLLSGSGGLGEKTSYVDFEVDLIKMSNTWTAVPFVSRI